jgi:hypothetical protein
MHGANMKIVLNQVSSLLHILKLKIIYNNLKVTGKQDYSKKCRKPVCKVGCTVRHRNSNALGLIVLQSIE